MAQVRHSVDVPGQLMDVETAWQHFVDGILTGKRRLACDELACVNAVEAGFVSFEEAPSGGTRVTFRVTLPDDILEDERVIAERELYDDKVSRDLVLFWDYIESGDYRGDRAAHEAAGRRGDEGRRRGAGRGPDQDGLSVRRTFRS
jgi:hypothetical protein